MSLVGRNEKCQDRIKSIQSFMNGFKEIGRRHPHASCCNRNNPYVVIEYTSVDGYTSIDCEDLKDYIWIWSSEYMINIRGPVPEMDINIFLHHQPLSTSSQITGKLENPLHHQNVEACLVIKEYIQSEYGKVFKITSTTSHHRLFRLVFKRMR